MSYHSPALEIRGVSRYFGALAALEDINIQVAGNERHAILGSNGAGKTTLFNIVCGELASSSGQVSLFGSDVTRQPVHRRIRHGLRRTYQHNVLFSSLTVEDNLYLAIKGIAGPRFSLYRRHHDRFAREQAKALAQRVDLADALHSQVNELAYGRQRQLEIGLALAGHPRLILFDEPAAGLSPVERRLLVSLIEGLPTDIAFVIIEHDLDIALRVAERVTVMHNGRVLTSGTPQEIENDSQVQAIYIGDAND